MMIPVRVILIVFSVLLCALNACETPSSRSSASGVVHASADTSLANELQRLGEIELRAIFSGDYETLLETWSDSAVVYGAMKPPLRGKAAIREDYMNQRKMGVKTHAFRTVTEKLWRLGNEIYEYGTWALAISTNDHPVPAAYKGGYFLIRERTQAGALLTTFMMTTVDHPLP